jgi:hypothetical protein
VYRLEELEAEDSSLLATKSSRTIAEYFFTITSCWCQFLLESNPDIDLLTYLDSDLCFFSSPQPLFDELGENSIGLIEHRTLYPSKIESRHGRFNVGWLSFRNDDTAKSCLRRWREQCLEWCFDRVEPGRFADQKYLDEWPERYASLRVICHPGANVAPWNVARYRFNVQAEQIFVDDQLLVFFHFQRLRPLGNNYISLGLLHYKVPIKKSCWLREHVYRDYIKQLISAEKSVNTFLESPGLVATTRQDDGTNPSMITKTRLALEKTTETFFKKWIYLWREWSGEILPVPEDRETKP